MAAKLILHRKGEWFNRRQQFKVVIGGTEMGTIKRGETLEFELTPGVHLLQCKINWMSSNEQTFEVSEEKNVYLTVGSGMKFFLPLYILMIIGLALPLLSNFFKIPVNKAIGEWRFILFIPGMLYIIAYYTFLRKKYLLIDQDVSNPFR